MWAIAKDTGTALHSSLKNVVDFPHTITSAIALRRRYDSFYELPEIPPEEWWDFPHLIRRHIDKLYPSSKNRDNIVTDDSISLDLSDIE